MNKVITHKLVLQKRPGLDDYDLVLRRIEVLLWAMGEPALGSKKKN